MPSRRIAVPVFPGTNCEEDVLHALRTVTPHEAELVWHREGSLDGFDAAVVPGGFAHGDYLRAGGLARFSPVMTALRELAESGRAVVGICNGFQILQEAGLLPGAMLRNRSLTYVCREVFVRAESRESPLTAALETGEVLRIPVGHAEGNFHLDDEALAELEAEGQVAFRYCGPDGESGPEAPPEANPNGSRNGVAGVRNRRGNVAALMPHPDRAYEPALGSVDGVRLFESLTRWLEAR